MEAEINKLKELYLKTNTPDFLDAHGVEDVFKRISSPGSVSHFYFSRHALIVSIICFVLVGVFGITTASSQPKSAFYPVKQFVQKITSAAVHFTPHETENSVKTILLQQHTPSPTLTPAISTTPTPTPKLEKHEDERKNTQHEVEREDINGNIIFPTQTPIPHHEDVQGASTSKSENSNSGQTNNTNKNTTENASENKQQNSGNDTGSRNGNLDHGNNNKKDN